MLLLDVQQPSTVGNLHEVRQKECMAQETSRMANSILGRLCFSRVNWHSQMLQMPKLQCLELSRAACCCRSSSQAIERGCLD